MKRYFLWRIQFLINKDSTFFDKTIRERYLWVTYKLIHHQLHEEVLRWGRSREQRRLKIFPVWEEIFELSLASSAASEPLPMSKIQRPLYIYEN